MSGAPDLTPRDRFNQALLANVHPPDWVNPEPAPRYNLVVIGGGTAGLVTAAGAAGLGAKVALVERHLLGGDCLNYGCVPSKAIIRSSRVVCGPEGRGPALGLGCRRGPQWTSPRSWSACGVSGPAISHHDSARRFRDLGVDVFLGAAQFTGPRRVEVAGRTLNFSKAVIATGARPLDPPVPGLAETGYLTNETVFSLTERPRRLLIMGGGPLGCEFAQAFQRLGCQVTLLHKYAHIMNREDADAATLVQKVFVSEGITLILNAKPTEVLKTAGGKLVRYESEGQAGAIEVDEILAGAGRAPNVDHLGLEEAGVKYDKREGVVVNDKLQTTNRHIYAAGDVCLKYKFTHMADASARIVIQNALFLGRKKVSALTIPWCTYTDPEVAHVGLNEAEAARQGLPIQTFIKPLSEVDRAIVDGEDRGPGENPRQAGHR